MNANNLLFWLSARSEGSWQQFRSAVEQLDIADEIEEGDSLEPEDASDRSGLPIYQELRLNLERLAHVEFFTKHCETGWRVAPPTLAVSPQTHGWLGVLCGARSSLVLSRLRDAVTAIDLEVIDAPACPDHIRAVASDHKELSSVAHRAGLDVQMNAPVVILLSHPAIDDFAMRSRFELPLGSDWSVHQFSSSNLAWIPTSREEAARSPGGLFRFIYQYQRYFFYCVRGHVFRIPNQVGKYVVLRRHRRSILGYDTCTDELRVPAICRPPKLIERALILCSGVLPAYDSNTKMLCYSDVPEAVVRLAAQLLRQEIV